MDNIRLKQAFEQFDLSNSADPNHEQFDGRDYPKELLYAQRMTEWQERFAPDASEALRLAVRCQHLQRWVIPRKSYPMDRIGYLKWRTDLKKMHAEKAAEILREVGYEDDMIVRVQTLLRKEGIKSDEEVQSLEDIICLVFLNYYFADFAQQHEDAKIVDIVRKTWAKMSPQGHEAALTLDLSERDLSLVSQALSS